MSRKEDKKLNVSVLDDEADEELIIIDEEDDDEEPFFAPEDKEDVFLAAEPDSRTIEKRLKKQEKKSEKKRKREEKRADRKIKRDENKKPDNIEELPTELPFFMRLLIRLGIIAAVIIAAIIFLNVKCRIKKINVTGSSWYEDEEIISMLKTSRFDDYSVFFKAHYTFEEFPGIAFIEKLSLSMDSLDTMTIKVYEKNIVGCIHIMDDYMYFDKDGIIVASRTNRQNDIPMVDGLDFTQATINKKLEVSNDKVYEDILQITQLIDKYEVKIDRIHFDDSLAVTLYCTDRNVIYCGVQDRYDEIIQALPGILSAAEERDALYRLDMSEFTRNNTNIPAEFIEN